MAKKTEYEIVIKKSADLDMSQLVTDLIHYGFGNFEYKTWGHVRISADDFKEAARIKCQIKTNNPYPALAFLNNHNSIQVADFYEY